MRVERLPFTVYDIIGYYFPGALLCLGLFWIFSASAHSVFQSVLPSDLLENASFAAKLGHIGVQVALLVVVPYVAGHMVALVSALTVERLSIQYFGYPSSYMLPGFPEDRSTAKSVMRTKFWHGLFRERSIWIVNFFLCGLLPAFALLAFTGLYRTVIKPLPKEIQALIIGRAKELGGASFSNAETSSVMKFAEYYAWNNNPSAAPRMYNYIVVYGFLRQVTLTLYVLAVAKLISQLSLDCPFFHGTFVVIAVLVFSSWITLLAFLKFFRRYSEEALLAFATMSLKSDHDAKSAP